MNRHVSFLAVLILCFLSCGTAQAAVQYTVTDLGSTNGTQLNGSLVPPRAPQRLRQGDRIKIGEVEIEFRWS